MTPDVGPSVDASVFWPYPNGVGMPAIALKGTQRLT